MQALLKNRIRILALSALLLSGYFFLPADVLARHETASKIKTGRVETVSLQSFESHPKQKILVVLGLREEANNQVKAALAEEFGGLHIWHVEASAAAVSGYEWPAADTIVAAGKSSCQLVLQSVVETPVICTLLTEEGFLSLDVPRAESASVSALVIDQPVDRQRLVANRVYPSITRFSCFDGFGAKTRSNDSVSSADLIPFQSSQSLPVQLKNALFNHDALIATSDSSIYNASTLSTILLTAYGYAKPVIGFSRAYVNAGALITSYSTPSQVLRQVAKLLLHRLESDEKIENLLYPEYFSVADNQSVANSLGLIKEFRFTTGRTYTDADFQP